jgi:Ca2+:H+ antiporter
MRRRWPEEEWQKADGASDITSMSRSIRFIAGSAIAWGTVVAFLFFGKIWLGELGSGVKAAAFFLWLLAVIAWCAVSVAGEAEHLADLLGEPLGTLVLTLSIVIIEVALISALMLNTDSEPTLGRDTMFAILMIVLNGVVGLALLLGGWRHREQVYNLQGAVAYLAVIAPLSVIALLLPKFTASGGNGTLTIIQSFFFSLFTLLLYAVFLAVQTVRHRGFFAQPSIELKSTNSLRGKGDARPTVKEVGWHTLLLIILILPIVLLAKELAKLLEFGITALHAPPALGGVLIALIVFTPEGMSALRAALANELQRAINLSLGAAASTIGLTVPAVVGIGLLTGQQVVLGVDNASAVLLATTLLLSVLTFCGPRTTVLEGGVHLVMFGVYIVLIFSP